VSKIIGFLRKYWIEILVIGVLFIVMLMDCAPSLTWMNVDSDGAEYVMDAIYFYPAHHTSAPLYLLTGHLFEMIPFGTIYWRMSFMSAVFTLGTMIFIYLVVRRLLVDNKRKRFFALLATTIFGASALAISQAVIVETYAVVTFFSVGAYYFVIRKQWLVASMFLGMGLVTHHLILLTWLVLFVFNKEMRNWKRWGVSFLFLIFYLYMPLSVRFTDQPNMWGNTTIKNFFTNNISVFSLLVGKISIWDLPKRIFDTIGVLGISLGVALIPIVYWFFKKKHWRQELLWLFLLPIAYQASDLAPQVAKYMEASVAWGAIISVIVLSKWWDGGTVIKRFIGEKIIYIGQSPVISILKRGATVAVCIGAVALLIVNGNYWDIGRTLDKNLAANQFYEQELPKIPDGEIFITNGAWEWIEVFLYNKQNDRHIIPVCLGILAAPQYQKMLREQGVSLTDYEIVNDKSSHELNLKQVKVGLSIIAQNPNVWTSISTEPAVYGAVVVPAKGNEYEISRWVGAAEVNPKVQWNPSNPYDILTGAIEVEQWNFIVQSNRNAMWLFVLVTGGMIMGWYCWTIGKKLIKKKVHKDVPAEIETKT